MHRGGGWLARSALVALLFLALPSVASATPCNAYASGSTAVLGFGVPWNTLNSAHELHLNSDCGTASQTFTIGTGDITQIIYSGGYYWNASTAAWVPITFSGTAATGLPGWFAGNATYTLNTTPSATPQYWVGYVCRYNTSLAKWQCGCADSACTTAYWQLQASVLAPSSTFQVSGNTILDKNGNPVLWNGHGGSQNMVNGLTPSQFDTWFANAQTDKFNAAIVTGVAMGAGGGPPGGALPSTPASPAALPESADHTSITALDQMIIDSHGNSFWMHNTDNTAGTGKDVTKIYENGNPMGPTTLLVQLAYAAHVFWQKNSVGNWYSLAADGVTWNGPTQTPPF